MKTTATAPVVTHSPGPWRAHGNYDVIKDSNGETISDVYPTVCGRSADARQEANARLIAAAPDLLDALEFAIRILDRDGIRPMIGEAFTQTDLDVLHAAVRKAIGR